jgi:hypothetical protein
MSSYILAEFLPFKGTYRAYQVLYPE